MAAMAKLFADNEQQDNCKPPLVPAHALTAHARGVQARFLATYAKLGRLRAAADAIGIPMQRHYDWLTYDPEYPSKYAYAQRQIAGLIEDEMVRRAVDGYPEGVYYRGELVATETKYSDQLLVTLAKGLMPDKYGKQTIEETGTKTLRVEIVRSEPAQLAGSDMVTPQLASGETDDG